jgi:hypothetical protein
MKHVPDTNPRPWVYWLILTIGFVLAVLAVFGCGTPSVAMPRPEPELCTAWKPVNAATYASARVEAEVFRRATRGPSAVYFRRGPAYQYTYVDTGTGRASCLGEVHSGEKFVMSAVDPRRCE